VNHLVMLSGGAGSWAAARRVKERHGVENMTLLFADTLIEDEDLYRFMIEVVMDIGAKFVRIADGRDPWQVFEDVRYIGNTRVDPCSLHLKRKLLNAYRDKHFDPANTVVYNGLAWWESDRVQRGIARGAADGWRIESPMAEAPFMDPEDVLLWMEAEGIKRPRLYEKGFAHNNCGGFCVKAGQGSFIKLLDHFPERYAHHEAQEARLNAMGIKGTILRDRTGAGAKTKRMTLKDFRIRVETNRAAIDVNDVGGCGCALDD